MPRLRHCASIIMTGILERWRLLMVVFRLVAFGVRMSSRGHLLLIVLVDNDSQSLRRDRPRQHAQHLARPSPCCRAIGRFASRGTTEEVALTLAVLMNIGVISAWTMAQLALVGIPGSSTLRRTGRLSLALVHEKSVTVRSAAEGTETCA